MVLNILRTAHAVGITVSHRAAACNVLSALLDRAFVSPLSEMRSFILSVEIWRAYFDVYMDRYGDSKPKPLKQLLVALANSLSEWPSPQQAQALKKDVLETFLFWIQGPDYTSRLKPALQGLAYFASKGIFSVQDVVVSLRSLFLDIGSPPVDALITRVTEDGRAAARHTDMILPGPGLVLSSEDVLGTFLSNLLVWVSYTSVETAASQLISTFFKLLRKHSSKEISFYHSVTRLPLWVAPLKGILNRMPETLEALKHHVLPELFRLSSEDLRDFIESLHLEHCLSGKVSADGYSDVLLLLSSLQVAQGLNLVQVTGKSVPLLSAARPTFPRLLTSGRSGGSECQE